MESQWNKDQGDLSYSCCKSVVYSQLHGNFLKRPVLRCTGLLQTFWQDNLYTTLNITLSNKNKKSSWFQILQSQEYLTTEWTFVHWINFPLDCLTWSTRILLLSKVSQHDGWHDYSLAKGMRISQSSHPLDTCGQSPLRFITNLHWLKSSKQQIMNPREKWKDKTRDIQGEQNQTFCVILKRIRWCQTVDKACNIERLCWFNQI